MKETAAQMTTGVLGLASGVSVSLSDIEAGLRVLSLLVGIVIGALSAYSLWLTVHRKKDVKKSDKVEQEVDA